MDTTQSLRGLAALAAAFTLAACGGGSPPVAEAPGPVLRDAAAPAAIDFPAEPPPPLGERPIDFPPFRELTLPNGLRMILVEQHEQPILSVDLYVESGSANDPAAVAGLAGMVADLLTKGTPTRTAEEIARTIEGVGGQLSAGAAQDYIRVGAVGLAEDAELLFDLVSDVSLHPTFPQDELELTRTRTLTGLEVEMSDASAVAFRRLMEEIYGGGHPYSLAPVPETVEAIDREAVETFHQEHFKADNALLVVSGDFDGERVEAIAREHFGQWEGGGVPEPSFVEPPALEETRIFLVHRPGSVQSSIQIGHVAIQPDNPDYYPLQVLNKVVGSGTDSRLFLILREQHGWTYGPASSLSRPEDVGYFSASAEVRNEVTDSAVVEILAQLRRIRDEPVPQPELEAAKSFLTGSFPLRIETPAAVARQVAQVRLLGLPIEALTEYRDRIAAVTSEDVQRVAREYIRPGRAAIVVVGDATQVLDDLEAIAPVTLTDIEGNPLDLSDLEVTSSGASFDASRLQPMTLRYRVLFQGNPFGSATTTLTRDAETWSASTTVQAGPMMQSSDVRFGADFTPISLRSSLSQAGAELGSDLAFADGRVTGTVRLPPQMGGEREIDTEVPQGTLLSGMDAFALAASDLAVGATIAMPLFTEQSGSVVQATYQVTAEEPVNVPAGTFDAYRVEMSAGPQTGTLWLRREAPHVTLRQEFEGQPIVIELEAL